MAEMTFGGGINEMDDAQVKLEECTAGYNFELALGNTHFVPRKPFDLIATATNAGSINGFIQLIKADDSETTLVQAGDTVYQWDGSTTFTSRGTVSATSKLRGCTWSLGGYSVITDLNKLTPVKKWDGTSFTTLTTGLSNPLYAKYALVHLGRVWLFNVTYGSDTQHLIVVSAYETPTSYDTSVRAQDSSFSTGSEAFYMVTPDLLPINGVALFFNTLVISTAKGRLYTLQGDSSVNFEWIPFYTGSAAIGTETMSTIGNDMAYMRNGGVIESLKSTQNFGDVKTDDLSRWIPDTVAGLTDAITVYDQERQKVYFFAGSNKVLVLFKEMLATELSPWSVYQTNHASSFAATSAIYIRAPGGSLFYVYWGDANGRIFQMEGGGAGDPSSNTITSYRRSKYIDTMNSEYQRVRGRVEYKRIAALNLVMDFEWADDYAINRCTVPLEGPPSSATTYFNLSAYFGGSFYFNSGYQYAERVSTKGFSAIGRGPGFYLMLTVDSVSSFDILKIRDAT